MKKDYIEPIIELEIFGEINCLTVSQDNWQEDPRIGGWGDWIL